MKKVIVTVLYKRLQSCYELHNLVVNNVNFGCVSLVDMPHEFIGIRNMIRYVLSVLENNNMRCTYYSTAGARWYNMQFVNIETEKVDMFAYTEKGATE